MPDRLVPLTERVQLVAGLGLVAARLTTDQRDAIAGADLEAGLQIFNVTTSKMQYWDGSAWVDMNGGGGGGSYATIYTGAAVTPQVALWTIVDGTGTQTGNDAKVTTGATSITIPSSVVLDGVFDLALLPALSVFNAGSTTGWASPFVTGAAGLSSINLGGSTVQNVDVSANTGTLDLNLAGCTSLVVVTLCPTIHDLNCHGCANLGSINVAGCNVLRVLDLYGTDIAAVDLTACGGPVQLTVENSTVANLLLAGSNLVTLNAIAAPVSTIDVSGLAHVADVTASNCPNLSSIDANGSSIATITATGCTSLASLDLRGCPNLTTCDFVNGIVSTVQLDAGTASISSLGLFGNALGSATVDAILVHLDNQGNSNGFVDVSGGTSVAPTVVGAAAALSLQGKGWIVNVNP